MNFVKFDDLLVNIEQIQYLQDEGDNQCELVLHDGTSWTLEISFYEACNLIERAN
jgi:hypothetical protein